MSYLSPRTTSYKDAKLKQPELKTILTIIQKILFQPRHKHICRTKQFSLPRTKHPHILHNNAGTLITVSYS